tara:strand:- start:167 stop:616 length:450 start_codon:yes stop_codon:yes gene_type:complete
MRVVIQRVSKATVTIENNVKAAIDQGLLVLAGFENKDTEEDLVWMCNKLVNLRIFNDTEGKMNLSVLDLKGSILLISQFTLFAATKKGNRPSFIQSAKPEIAIPLYEKMIQLLATKVPTQTGEFGADMKIDLLNDGPVTICIDSKKKVS